MQEDDDGTIGGPGFGIADTEDAGLDLFQRGKRGVGARPDLAHAGLCVAGLRKEGATHGERCGRKRHGGGAEEAASVRAGVLGHGNLTRLYI